MRIDRVPRLHLPCKDEKSARELKLRRGCVRQTTAAGRAGRVDALACLLRLTKIKHGLREDTMPDNEKQSASHNVIGLLMNDHRVAGDRSWRHRPSPRQRKEIPPRIHAPPSGACRSGAVS
jgi:hypothetical protein